jgi:hypothetical protein
MACAPPAGANTPAVVPAPAPAAALPARSAPAVAPAATPAEPAPRRGNVLRLRKPEPVSDSTPTVEYFAQLAAGRDVDALYATFGDEPVQANGERALKHYLATEVMPFFADFDRLADTTRVVRATFADDSVGQIAYAYAVTREGRLKPFIVAWRTQQGQPRLMDIKVGGCVPARHPVVPGGCER